jgi:hypothetical protein
VIFFFDKVYFTHLKQLFVVVKVKVVAFKINKKYYVFKEFVKEAF